MDDIRSPSGDFVAGLANVSEPVKSRFGLGKWLWQAKKRFTSSDSPAEDSTIQQRSTTGQFRDECRTSKDKGEAGTTAGTTTVTDTGGQTSESTEGQPKSVHFDPAISVDNDPDGDHSRRRRHDSSRRVGRRKAVKKHQAKENVTDPVVFRRRTTDIPDTSSIECGAITHGDSVPSVTAYLKSENLWPHDLPLGIFKAATTTSTFAVDEEPVDSIFGNTAAYLDVCTNEGTVTDRYVMFDPGIFYEYINEHDWYDGDESPLSREDRMFLLNNLTGGGMRSLRKRHSTDLSACTFPVDDGDIEPEDMQDDTVADPVYGPVEHDDVSAPCPLTAAQKKTLHDIHNNCGHPSRQEFLRQLRMSKANQNVLDYVRHHFNCPACDAKGTMPKPRPPASLPKTFRFNMTVGVDLFEIENHEGNKVWMCNMICWGTLYQICVPIPDKTALTVAKCMAEHWIRYFGPPTVVISDQGREFVGQQFKEFCGGNGILLHVTDVRAPWQNGRTERHGDIWKKIFTKAMYLCHPSGDAA